MDGLSPPRFLQPTDGGKPTRDVPSSHNFPTSFAIGSEHTLGPLVGVAQLKGHLALLRAFVELKKQVDEYDDIDESIQQAIPIDKERRWGWFVGLAVERFSTWCFNMKFRDISGKPIEDVLPPIDVMMVWHTYMLNPGWYAEDVNRIPPLGLLRLLGIAFAEALPQLPNILALEPSATRIGKWSRRTRRIFGPLEDAVRQNTKTIRCPMCRHPLRAPLMTREGDGYLQQNFGIRCAQPDCIGRPIITRAVLATRKFAEDLVRDDGSDRMYLPGTLYSPLLLDFDFAHAIKSKNKFLRAESLRQPESSTKEQWIMSILRRTKCSLHKFEHTMSLDHDRDLVPRILSAYVDDRVFSVELVGAVLRQGSFVKKMDDLQWTHPDFFSSPIDEIVLQHAIARYHAFLDLMATSPTSLFVPTLDIDLVWHTHQLMHRKYIDDCRKYVGRFVNHDDKVGEIRLASSFDNTCRAWEYRFGVRYTHCGCPVPGETIGHKLSRLVGAHSQNSSHLVPPYQSNAFSATHPSDHNAVFMMHKRDTGELAQEHRRKKFKKRQRREEELAKSGRLDTRIVEPTQRHEQAFLIPVPLYFKSGPGREGCTAGTGSFIDNSTASAGSSEFLESASVYSFDVGNEVWNDEGHNGGHGDRRGDGPEGIGEGIGELAAQVISHGLFGWGD